MERMPPEKVELLKKKASSLLAEIPQTAARGVDSVMRSMKGGRDHLQRWARRHTALVIPGRERYRLFSRRLHRGSAGRA